MLDAPPFWLVWSPTGPTEPRMRYASRKWATHAAKKMAQRHPRQEFFVLKTQSRHERRKNFLLCEWGVGIPCPHHHPRPKIMANPSLWRKLVGQIHWGQRQ